ncbi:MAG: BrnT family toxin [Betaproteobacteria bacterium]
MVFEWDEAKRRLVLEKHGIDFVDALRVFAGPKLVLSSPRGEEPRWMAIGYLNGRCIAVVYTMRGGVLRIITARRARDHEREEFDAHVAG